MKTLIVATVALALASGNAMAQYYPNGQTPPVHQAPVWSPPVTGYPAPYAPPYSPYAVSPMIHTSCVTVSGITNCTSR